MPSLRRVPIRTRESDVTLSAWRLDLSAERGTGGIVLLESRDGGRIYRGEGACLGWSQAELAAEYAAFPPADGEPPLATQQLG